MSVINKMLRDLDQRNAGQGANGEPVSVFSSSSRNAAGAMPPASSGVAWGRVVAALCAMLLVAGAAVGGWVAYQSAASPESAMPATVSAVAVPVLAAASAQLSVASAAGAAPVAPEARPLVEAVQPVAPQTPIAPEPAPVQSTAQPALSKSIELKLAARLPGSPQSAGQDKPELKAAVAPEPAPLPKVATAPVQPAAVHTHIAQVPAPPVTDAQLLQRQQQAGKEALAQAQVLWSSGNREAANSLLVDAVAVSEKSAIAAANTTLLVQQVRELTRMELADGRAQAVIDLLMRLEPVLGGQPDLWAVRANAAQRLGRHQDSVNAYREALKVRPTEQRWLLGSAVSLAALGQLAEAADMTERARKVGTVSPEVLAYLRQQGVPIGER